MKVIMKYFWCFVFILRTFPFFKIRYFIRKLADGKVPGRSTGPHVLLLFIPRVGRDGGLRTVGCQIYVRRCLPRGRRAGY
jgi:hypothetical protein